MIVIMSVGMFVALVLLWLLAFGWLAIIAALVLPIAALLFGFTLPQFLWWPSFLIYGIIICGLIGAAWNAGFGVLHDYVPPWLSRDIWQFFKFTARIQAWARALEQRRREEK